MNIRMYNFIDSGDGIRGVIFVNMDRPNSDFIILPNMKINGIPLADFNNGLNITEVHHDLFINENFKMLNPFNLLSVVRLNNYKKENNNIYL